MKDYIPMKIEVIWQGNPIQCTKTFKTHACQLCMKERISILRHIHKDPTSMINRRNEIYGTCRHNARFHRLDTTDMASTDESKKDERVTRRPLQPCAAKLNANQPSAVTRAMASRAKRHSPSEDQRTPEVQEEWPSATLPHHTRVEAHRRAQHEHTLPDEPQDDVDVTCFRDEDGDLLSADENYAIAYI